MTDKAKQIRLEAPDDNGVAVVWIDMPDSKVNVLNTDTLPEFNALMEEVVQYRHQSCRYSFWKSQQLYRRG